MFNLMFRTIGQIIRYKQYFFIDLSIYHDREQIEMSEGFIHEFTVPGRDNEFAFLNEAFQSRGFQSKEFEEGIGLIVTQSHKISKLRTLREGFNQQRSFTDPRFPSLLLQQSSKSEVGQARQMCEDFLELWNGLLYASMLLYGRNATSVVFTSVRPQDGNVTKKKWHQMRYFGQWSEEIDQVLDGVTRGDALLFD